MCCSPLTLADASSIGLRSGIGRQVDELTAPTLDQLPGPRTLVEGEVAIAILRLGESAGAGPAIVYNCYSNKGGVGRLFLRQTEIS